MDKLVFISNMAAPYQVKFCSHLQKYFQTEFWFHVHLEKNRPDWWKIDLGDSCKIFENVKFQKSKRYLALDIFKMLNTFDPDIILLGGFTHPTNIIAYYWGKIKKKKVVLFTESYRGRENEKNVPQLKKKGIFTKFVNLLYKNINLILTNGETTTEQFKNEFGFNNVITAHYPADIDDYFFHPIRKAKEAYTYIFANRLMETYNPLLAIRIFNNILAKYPNSILKVNNSGPQLADCKELIKSLKIEKSVVFLDAINNWNDLHKVYQECDILIFPAKFSNGNFTIFEAMASGMGIILSENILGVLEGVYIDDQKSGYLCQLNEEAFENAINQYIANPLLFEKHTKINRAKVKKFTYPETAKLFYNLIK